MSAYIPASQVLQRHESLFTDKSILVSGDIHDDYALQINSRHTNIHCTLYHVYLKLSARNRDCQIEFGVFPSDACYEDVDTLIYYWPKNKTEAQFQLSFLLNHLPKNADIFIVGENRSGVKSIETLLSDFGSIQKIDSARRCGLYHYQAENRLAFDFSEWWYQYHLQLDNIDLTINSLPGVFSQKTLDIGSELLINALAEHSDIVKGRVLDVGCGCGVLSTFAYKLNSHIQLVCSDVNAMALSATKQTLSANQINADVVASDVFSNLEGRFDLIISNPPFHDGKETDYNAVDALIHQSKQYLSQNGKLCLVANSFLPYHRLLVENFKQVSVIAQTSRFKVYLVE